VQHDFHFPTGTVPVTFENNQPHYVITPNVAFDHIMYNDNIASAAASADAFYFGTLIQREEISSATLGAIIKLLGPNCHRVLDINLRAHCYSREILEWSLDHATMVKLSDQEALYIAHEFGLKFTVEEDLPAEIAKTWGLQACIVTHGANGVFAYGANEPPIHIPGMTVDVVDTVGAGDAFIAGVVHRLLRSGTLAAACRFGNALGAMVATVQGGTAPVDYKRVASLANEPAAPAAQS
jgi:fructokinase